MWTLAAIPAVLALATLWLVWWLRRRLRGPDLLTHAIVLALVPAAAAAGVAGWTVRAVFMDIAESGSGGARMVVRSMLEPGQALLVGAVSAPIVVAGAIALIALGRGFTPSELPGRAPRAGWPVITCVIGFALTALVVRTADRTVFGSLANLTPLMEASGASVPTPPRLVGTPDETAAAWASAMERRVPIATWGASTLCGLLIVAAVISARSLQASGRSVGWPAAISLAAASLGAAAGYGSYLWSAVRWLGVVVREGHL